MGETSGSLSVLGLMLPAPILARIALRFGPQEQVSLMVLGLVILAHMGTGSVLKSLLQYLSAEALEQYLEEDYQKLGAVLRHIIKRE